MKSVNKKRRSIVTLSVFACLILTQCRDSTRFYTNTLRSNIFNQVFSDDRYDFLWVFDNSNSMVPTREYIKNEMNTFLSILNSRKAIDYQMAMTTTDYFHHATLGDWLVSNTNGVRVVSSESSDPVGDFASLVNNISSTFSSFWEQGLENAYQAIARHGGEFMREGVPLIIIFVTDEEDYSCQSNCWGVEPENNNNWVPHEISRYINYFSSIKTSEATTVSIFPIVGKASAGCLVASYGERYQDVQEQVDAVTGEEAATGSICTEDLESSYGSIAQNIADRGSMFLLSEQASGKGLIVFVDGEKIPYSPDNGFVYDEENNAIVFTGNAIPDNGATIEVAYAEARN